MISTLNRLYCGLRGYRRFPIRRKIARSCQLTPAAIREKSERLFQQRVAEAMWQFPAYARKVESHLGRTPAHGEDVQSSLLPVWTRQDQQALFDSLPGPPLPKAILHRTGGTNGTPTRFYMTRESYEWRMAVSERGYSWAQAEEGRDSVYIWGTHIEPLAILAAAKQALHRKLQKRTFFDGFHFSDEDKIRCCDLINRRRPHALVGYASNLVALADFVLRQPDALQWRAKTIVSTAEGMTDAQRSRVEAALGGELFMSYGSREFMLIGMECRCHDGYHLSEDNLLVEIVDDDGLPLPDGSVGRILISDLHNRANPFIRYEIGDLGVRSADRHCPCGLPLRRLQRVDGRSQDIIKRPDGEKVTGMLIPHLMKEFNWVNAYQLVQDIDNEIEVRLVADTGITDEQMRSVEAGFRKFLGDELRIRCGRVDTLEKCHSGKTPQIITRGDN